MYIPLRIYSQFSVGFGAVKLDDIVSYAKEFGVPAAGIADHNTLGGALTLSKSLSGSGVQPLIGTSLEIAHGEFRGQITLFATSQAGYGALLRCVNRRNLDATTPALTLAELGAEVGDDASEIIALTGGKGGLIETMIEAGRKTLPVFEQLHAIFGARLYVELQRDSDAPGPNEATLLKAAEHFDLPAVATAPAHYPRKSDQEAHDVFLCISDKTFQAESHRRHAEAGRHLVSPDEMIARFADMPEAITNTVEIARKCAFMLKVEAPVLPAFPTENGESEEDALRRLARAGLKDRLSLRTGFEDTGSEKEYQDRLEYEIGIILRMGFPGYFLIVSDFIGWARENAIPVGPGRGSGAGSLVAYALGITDIDPLEFNLIFERFLNPERVSMPDFDVDFSRTGREQVIDYVRGKYGADRVAQISAFGTLQARAAVRDVARVLQISYPVADRYAKMIPKNSDSLAEAMEDEDLARAIEDAGEDIAMMFKLALQVEGLYRTITTHAAGIIISDKPVAEVVPCHLDQHGKLSTSFEMKAVEASGLVKFDFLGLKNLDIIEGACAFIEQTKGETIDIEALGFSDPKTFAQLAGGDGFSVFQLESAGMRQAMKQLKVDNIDDLIALISLYRPGPMDQIKTYADVKHGQQDVHYDHPETQAVLEPTNGVMIYQEQVMEIARRLAGYSMGDADLLRRAMGKKIQAEMDAQSARFAAGAAAGWVEVETEDGQSRQVHALSRVPVADGSGRTVTLQEALEQQIEVAI